MSNVKVFLTVFFDCTCVVDHKFLPWIYPPIARLILHHNNALAHTSMLVCEFLAKYKTVIMPQPPYSQDLTPADFFFFPKLKTPLKGKRFSTIEEIKEKSIQELLAIPKSAFQKYFEDWKKCWHKFIISEGSYLQGGQYSYL